MTNPSNQKVIILKIGGNVISNKNEPKSIHSTILQNILNQISEFTKNSPYKLIIVHGGGSFGHPTAKKYRITHGFNPQIKNQIEGLIETHNNMLELNKIIFDLLKEHQNNIITLNPVDIFFYNQNGLIFTGKNQIKILLELDIIPILYGDIILHENKKFTILSGDRIIRELCESFGSARIKKVIFTLTEEGLLKSNSTSELGYEKLTEVKARNLTKIKLHQFSSSIDVTGGIKGKLKEIEKICDLGITVQLINGIKAKTLESALKTNKKIGTLIIP